MNWSVPDLLDLLSAGRETLEGILTDHSPSIPPRLSDPSWQAALVTLHAYRSDLVHMTRIFDERDDFLLVSEAANPWAGSTSRRRI